MSQVILSMELEAVAEPKELLPAELLAIVKEAGSYRLAAEKIGASEAFVRQTIQGRRGKLKA